MSPEIEDLLRAEAPQVLGALVRRLGRFDLAEDAVQEALLAAARSWPREGVPREPRSWLIRVGYRRMVDLLRSDRSRRLREERAGAAEAALLHPGRSAPPAPEADDSLTLLLLCCHPALGPASRAALTLRAVGGLTTAEIARAYGTTEAAMGTRIGRAKRRLASAGARFTPPVGDDLEQRLASVMQVLYLVFNEGYTATSGASLSRTDLSGEAIRLARMLGELRPHDGEAAGLLALMLLTEARGPARTGSGDELLTLDHQDRSRWDRALIREGTALLDAAWDPREAGPYRLQAAVAAVHAAAPSPRDTDWTRIAVLYLWLERLSPSAPVRLARVAAVSRAYGAGRGLALLADLDRRHGLAQDPLTRRRHPAVLAHLLEETGETGAAAAAYRRAAALAANPVEEGYLLDRADRLD
ncbi:RNA polymerase sigma factor [Nocardiopsis flavescens]|uniref:RNA polymerase sigma factor, sigma-70 family n=1 Tax=Nocardiopsis flavescens TaxID=758803 RepID=A0A1M6B5B5_9ACTN|nr:DUF6596 domain-containing protein [Nocardiopsis flavescens]SHI43969.1 RNA polymerase sigma factor, sigma-70 family [Nocardiopsis flavescens]